MRATICQLAVFLSCMSFSFFAHGQKTSNFNSYAKGWYIETNGGAGASFTTMDKDVRTAFRNLPESTEFPTTQMAYNLELGVKRYTSKNYSINFGYQYITKPLDVQFTLVDSSSNESFLFDIDYHVVYQGAYVSQGIDFMYGFFEYGANLGIATNAHSSGQVIQESSGLVVDELPQFEEDLDQFLFQFDLRLKGGVSYPIKSYVQLRLYLAAHLPLTPYLESGYVETNNAGQVVRRDIYKINLMSGISAVFSPSGHFTRNNMRQRTIKRNDDFTPF